MTQQLRLRHLYQIMAYNVTSQCGGSFYYTLHLTTMCAPFYTSEKSDSLNPKWKELDMGNLPYPSASAFVLRIWQIRDSDMDVVITTWGINLSGLIYLGIKLSEIQPECFNENSVIFHLRGGFFASYDALRTDLQKPLQFIDNLNVTSTEFETAVYRNTVLKSVKTEVKHSYTVDKLQKLHSLQIIIKNKSSDVQALRDKITTKCGLCDCTSADEVNKHSPSDNPSPVHRHSSQLLTMTTLNKMLQWQGKPTKYQRQQIAKVNKQIEIAKFRTKLLAQERDKKSAHIRQLKQSCTASVDENEERGSLLMENYRKLSRDSEKLKEWRKEQFQLKELLLQANTQLHHRRRQLMSQLLFIYPIQQVSPRKCVINGIYLPDSEMLSDCSDGGLAVALGHVSHILLMCASFLQVPLRYPIMFFGSRSHISDHITAALSDKDRDFPLYAKGKDRMQFNYAVYLLNKNIAQLRWLCGQHTPDLRATLSNLHALLQGCENKESSNVISANKTCQKVPQPLECSSYNSDVSEKGQSYSSRGLDFIGHFDKTSSVSDPILDTLRHECQLERSQSPTGQSRKKSGAGSTKSSESKPGLSEILAIPEAFMSQQISQSTFKSYIATEKIRRLNLTDHKPESDSHSKTSASQSNSETKSNPSCDTLISSIKRCAIPVNTERPLLLDSDSIEQGTDILHSSLNLAQDKSDIVDTTTAIVEEYPKSIRLNCDKSDRILKQNRRISRSVGSITEEENVAELHSSLELGSDPLLNLSSETTKSFGGKNLDLGSLSTNLEDGQQEFLQKWLDSGPALVCSEENLYPDEILGTTVSVAGPATTNSPLTLRTDALLNTTSFNLIKPK